VKKISPSENSTFPILKQVNSGYSQIRLLSAKSSLISLSSFFACQHFCEEDMNRVVFERSLCDGFRTTKVESMISSLYGKKIFVGTNDGSLVAYDCRQESSSIGTHIFEVVVYG
jgi:hypothetical protein